MRVSVCVFLCVLEEMCICSKTQEYWCSVKLNLLISENGVCICLCMFVYNLFASILLLHDMVSLFQSLCVCVFVCVLEMQMKSTPSDKCTLIFMCIRELRGNTFVRGTENDVKYACVL